jgi:integrase
MEGRMTRAVSADIGSRSKRLRLAARKDPYYRQLQSGLAIGYYRPASGGDGTWWGRVRANGRYVVEAIAAADDYVDPDGETILSWSQAQAVVREWAARQTGTGPLTVADVVRDYLDDLRARKGERAAAGAEGRVRKHLLPVLGDRRIADLTASDMTSFRNGMVPANATDEERRRRSLDSANRVLNVARAALNHAFKAGRIADDRAWRRVSAFRNVGMARKVIFDPIELQALIDACEFGLRELVAVAAQTGARLGELTAAKVRDFDADAGTLLVSGKTGSRSIYLAPATALLLRRAASGKRPDDLLLPPADRPSWSHNLHSKRFAVAVRKAGLDPAATFYALRHSFISHALRNLLPVKAVADHVGSSMVMLERHYAKFIAADRRRYAEIACPELSVDGSTAEVVHIGAAR